MRFARLRKPNKAGLLGWAFPVALMLGVGVMGAVRGGQMGSDIAWQGDFEAARRQAKRAGRSLLLEFHASDCALCAKMEAETFADERVVDLSRRFTCVRLDGETETVLAQRYHVLAYPTTVFADALGNVTGSLTGYVSPARFAAAERAMLNRTK